MKKIFFNKYIICIVIVFISVGGVLELFSYNQHRLYTENKEYIVILDARVSSITENWNPSVDDDDYYKYTIALSYTYDGQDYVDRYLKDVTGDSYEDIYYKVGDKVEIVIFSHTPDKIVSDNPEDANLYLQDFKSFMPYFLLVTIFIYIIYIIFVIIFSLFKRRNR